MNAGKKKGGERDRSEYEQIMKESVVCTSLFLVGLISWLLLLLMVSDLQREASAHYDGNRSRVGHRASHIVDNCHQLFCLDNHAATSLVYSCRVVLEEQT